jgi:hypothetical protein
MRNALWKVELIMLCAVFLLQCQRASPKELVLFDYESNSELDQLQWHCHVLISISDEHYTHGSKSLKVSLYPSDYPGLDIIPRENDWRMYRELSLDVYNPQENRVPLSVRIDDREGSPAFKERYNRSFVLRSGINHIRIPFDSLARDGSGSPLNLKSISRLIFFVAHPVNRVDLYFDYLRLAPKAFYE